MIPYASFARPLIFGALLWAVCLYALRRGGAEERIAAVGMFLNAYLTLLVVGPVATRFRNVETAVVLVDLALLALLLWLMLRSRQFWPMWLAAMHGTATLSHLAGLVPHLAWVYGTAVAFWSYPMLILLGFAVRAHAARRLREGGVG